MRQSSFEFRVSSFGLEFRVNAKLATRNSKLLYEGQAIVEYAILVGIVTAALMTMQTYMKRGVQAGIKVAADQFGDQRQGLKERDKNRNWIVKDESKVTANTPPSTGSVELRPDGVTVYRTAYVTTGSGRQSFSLGAERDQEQ